MLIRNFYVAWILLLALGLIDNALAIEGLHLALGTIDSDYAHAEQVKVDLDWQDPHRLELSVSARQISSPYVASISTLDLACRDVAYRQQQLRCSQGILRLVFADGGKIEAPIDFTYDDRPGGRWQFGTTGLGMDLSRFKGLLQALFPGQKLKTGRLQARLSMSGEGGMLTGIAVDGGVKNFSMDGGNVFENTSAEIHLDTTRQDERWVLDSAITLSQGVMYIMAPV